MSKRAWRPTRLATLFYFQSFHFYSNLVKTDSLKLPSFAKVNLHLRVLGKREDGFHEVFTVFQTVSLFDEITFEPAESLSLTCDDPTIPVDESNLIIHAAKALTERIGGSAGARMHLIKKIPSPGGLGGGSSNAATALLGLRRLWNVEISDEELTEIASELGSDVPYFLIGGTAVGFGRGEQVEPIKEFAHGGVVVVTPPVAISTSDAYRRLGMGYLTKSEAEHNLSVCRTTVSDEVEWQKEVVNDFESTAFADHSEIRTAYERLIDLGARAAGLSGSGASVFGYFDNEETRQTAMKALGNEANWRSFAVATISRVQYREALKQVF